MYGAAPTSNPRPLRGVAIRAHEDEVRMFRTLIVSAVLSAALATSAAAQTLTRGPLIQNPAAITTTMTILWWTDVTGDSTVEYGLTPSLGSSVNVAQAGSCEIGAAGTCHAVPLTGLQPGTRYYYRLLTNGTQVLATTYFQTFKTPSDPSELYFTVIGDWGQGTSQQGQIGNNMNADDPPLVMTVGDNAYTNGTQSDWDNNVFISQWKNGILRRAVFMPTLGNHDLNNVGNTNWASSVEIKMHQLPRNAPAGQEERYFSFDYGDAHFVVMDANPPGINSTQTNWAAADLAATTRKWKFVFLHQTPYSCANGFASIGSDHTVRNTWGPIFEQYGVDIVFIGHDHSYERSHAVDDYLVGGGSGSDGKSTYYIMTGGGGAALDGAAQVDGGGPYGQGLTHGKEYCPWLATDCSNGVNGIYCSFSKYQHTEVRIANDSVLTLKSIDNNDSVFDTWVLNKTSICGNGTVESGEQCDQGAANGTATSCCDASCQFVSIGTTCRTATGPCDVAETCSGASGTCPGNGFASSSTVCRPSAGGCDPAELCTGSTAACPADTLSGNGVVCRAAAGACDLEEVCNGVSAACPADAKSTAPCRNAIDLCDAVESCDGVSNTCPADAFAPNGTPCRVAVDQCDVTEACTGTSAACPPDGFASASVVCRPATSICDLAENCTGVGPGCPEDFFAANTVVCRPATGRLRRRREVHRCERRRVPPTALRRARRFVARRRACATPRRTAPGRAAPVPPTPSRRPRRSAGPPCRSATSPRAAPAAPIPVRATWWRRAAPSVGQRTASATSPRAATALRPRVPPTPSRRAPSSAAPRTVSATSPRAAAAPRPIVPPTASRRARSSVAPRRACAMRPSSAAAAPPIARPTPISRASNAGRAPAPATCPSSALARASTVRPTPANRTRTATASATSRTSVRSNPIQASRTATATGSGTRAIRARTTNPCTS